MKKYLTKCIVSFILLLLIIPDIIPNSVSIKNIGYAIVKNYTKTDYRSGTQTWDIKQDDAGFLYFANNFGVLQFDGTYWNTFPLPNKSIVRAVCIDQNNRIWAGGFNQIGYFLPDDKGQLKFTSVLNLLEPKYRDFGEIWNIYRDNNRILIQTFTTILEYKDGLLRPLVWGNDLNFSFFVNNSLYIKVNNIGLHRLIENQLIPVKGGEIFANTNISAILPKDEKESYIITASEGIFIMNELGIIKLNAPINEFLRKNQVFDAIKFNNYLIIGTIQDGVVILDNKLNPIQHLNRERGLQNNTVLSLFIDREENLWLGLDNGIDYVKINSPLTYLANKNEIGAGYQVLLSHDKLFLGTNQGLFYLDWPPKRVLSSDNNISSLPGLQGQVWLLDNYKGKIICGHDKGTFLINGNTPLQISDISGAWNFYPVNDEGLFLQGTYSGIIVLQDNGSEGRLIFRNKIDGFNSSAKNLIISEDNSLWVAHSYKGIYHLNINAAYTKVLKQKHYTVEQGLPDNYGINLLQLDGQLIISSEKGYYYYSEEKDYFLPYDVLNTTFKNEVVITFAKDPNNKNTWFFSNKRMGILKPNFDGSYNIEDVPFVELKDKLLPSYESIYFLENTSIIICTADGFIHFDPTYKKKYNINYPAIIRRVLNSSDSIIYGKNGSEDFTKQKIEIKYNQNGVKFFFTTPIYESPGLVKYSFVLEGYDKDWSDWQEKAEKEYINLRSGNYVFKVKAQDSYGFESSTDSIRFTILPPFYLSWVAYVLYSIIVVIVFYFIILYVKKRFERQRRTLLKRQQSEMNDREKEFENESLKAEQEIIKLRNEKLMIENQKKQSEIENKTKELASIAMQITYKNEMLSKVRQKLSKVTQKMIHPESKQQVEALIKTLEKDMVRDDEWEKFEISFDQVHEDFLKKLRTNFPELSPKDLKLCAYLRMNLASKEIAPLLNISIRGVEISRYRLRRKVGLDRDVNLTEFMMNL